MSRIDRGPTEEAVLNPYSTDERLFRNAVMRAELAEAEVERLKTALVAIQSTTPGSAHRIAIQALAGGGDEMTAATFVHQRPGGTIWHIRSDVWEWTMAEKHRLTCCGLPILGHSVEATDCRPRYICKGCLAVHEGEL